MRLPREFFRRDAVTVARALLGQRFVRLLDGQRLVGTIVETEAYLGVQDRAAHSFGGRRTARNESMYADGGMSYVYAIYGLHHCLNVVCGAVDEPVAVLVRALEPVEGLDVMRSRRARARRDADLCSGPGKLCEALAIDRALDRVDLVTSDALFIESGVGEFQVATSPRIGVDYAGEWAQALLRFFVPGHAHVSRGRPSVEPTRVSGPSSGSPRRCKAAAGVQGGPRRS